MEAYARLLGSPGIDCQGRYFEPPPSKTSALLYTLAYRSSWVNRGELVYLFWPDRSEQQARRNLSRLLINIKEQPYAQGLEAEITRLRWQVGTDVQDYRQALDRSKRPAI